MSNPNSFHYYDVRAKHLESLLDVLIRESTNLKKDLDPIAFIRNYRIFLEREVIPNHPDIDDAGVISSNDRGLFIYYSSFHIMTCKIDEIDPFLDYQINTFNGTIKEFVDMVEYFIINSIKTQTPRENEQERISIVRKWVKPYRASYPRPTIKEVNTLESIDAKITVAPELIDECINKLELYFSKDNLPLFRKLLSGDSIDDKIIFLGIAGVLIDIFSQIKDKGLIIEPKSTINRWICRNFEYQKNGINVSFDPDYVKRVLTGQSTPTRKSRIVIDFPGE